MCLGLDWTQSQSFWPSTPSSVSSSCRGIERGENSVQFFEETTFSSALWRAVKMQAALRAARRRGRRGGRPRRSRRSRSCENSPRKFKTYFCHIQFPFPGCSSWLHPRPDKQGHLQHPDCVQQPDPEVRGGGPRLVLEREDCLPLIFWWGLESRLLWALITTFGSSEIAAGRNH